MLKRALDDSQVELSAVEERNNIQASNIESCTAATNQLSQITTEAEANFDIIKKDIEEDAHEQEERNKVFNEDLEKLITENRKLKQ